MEQRAVKREREKGVSFIILEKCLLGVVEKICSMKM